MYFVLLSLLFKVVTSYYSFSILNAGENYDPSALNSYDLDEQYFEDLTELIDSLISNDYNLYSDYYDVLDLPWAEYGDYSYDIHPDPQNNQEWLDAVGYLKNMTESDFQDLIASLDLEPMTKSSPSAPEKDVENQLPVLHRRKRSFLRSRSSRGRTSSSSRSSSSRSSSSRSSSSRGSSSTRRGWSWGRSRGKTTSGYPTTSKPKVTYPPTKAPTAAPKPSTLYPTAHYPSAGNTPKAGYPSVANSPTTYQQGNVPFGSSSAGTYPAGGYPSSGHKPRPGYPVTGNQPSPGYPTTGNQPSPGYPTTGNQPSPGYPTTGNQPSPGYPTTGNQPSPGYPTTGNQPSAGYPVSGTQPRPGYPATGNQPSPGYPTTGNQPSAGYPVTGTQPRPGYPVTGNQPSPGYPTTGNQPSPGYPTTGNQPRPGYPVSGNQPSPGYPVTGRQPTSGYPSSGNNPSMGYPTSGIHQPNHHPYQPSHGYPHPSSTNFGSQPNVGYPGASGTFAKPKLNKKQKIAKKIKQAIQAYGTYKLNKKMRKKNKFVSPSHFGMDSDIYGHHSSGSFPSAFGQVGKKKKKNKIKKVIGKALKLAVALYAIKYGVKAAKAYAEYKLGRSLKDAIIEKFVSKYHRQHERIHMRERKRFSKSEINFDVENITLGENCARDCHSAEQFTCFFDFQVHLYQTSSRACYNCPNVTADCERPECIVGSGRMKLVSVVNKQMPGPTIEVCQGDKVLIRVQNELPSSAITLHVRGQTYQDSQYFEGTPGLTQNPILPGDIFSYTIKADTSGTHFWHANTGVMRSEGIFGPFIVKEKEDPHSSTYDIDLTNQTLTISEDLVKGGEEQLVFLSQKKGSIEVNSLLINGRGLRQDPFSPDVLRSHFSYARITVLKGKRHRLRILSAVSTNCPFTFRVPGQQFKVIYADGFPVNLKEAKSLLVSPGERFDIVLNNLDGLHWIEVKGNLECANQTQYAILESIENSFFPLQNTNLNLNIESNTTADIKLPANNPKEDTSIDQDILSRAALCNTSEITCVRDLTALVRLPHRDIEANLTFYLSLTDRKIHNEHMYSFLHYNIEAVPQEEQSPTWQINNLTLKLPPDPLLLNEKPLKNSVCSLAGVLQRHCVGSFCECLHLMEIPLGSLVDLVLVNEGLANSESPQTMYFHGHNVWLISQSNEFIYSNETDDNTTMDYMTFLKVVIRDSEDLLVKNLENPVRINSITVPENGYSVIRFRADNPGYWLLESSSAFKSASGMGVVMKIGNKENWPPIPRQLSSCNKGS